MKEWLYLVGAIVLETFATAAFITIPICFCKISKLSIVV